MKNILIVDDEHYRHDFILSLIEKDSEVSICHAYTYNQAIDALENAEVAFDYIFLDHDLGGNNTGYDLCKWILNCKMMGYELSIHDNSFFVVHTMNPVGAKNMYQVLLRVVDKRSIFNSTFNDDKDSWFSEVVRQLCN